MNTRKWFAVLLLFVLLVALALPTRALAAPVSQRLLDKVVFGENYTLQEGETLSGDLIVFGGNVTMEKGAHVEGNVVVMGGNLTAEGVVEGDLLIVGGSVKLAETSLVEGNVTAMGGWVDKRPGAEVRGEITTQNQRSDIGVSFGNEWTMPGAMVVFSPVWDALWMLFSTFVMAALAILVVMVLPAHTERVARTAFSQPIVSGGMGLLTLVATPFVLLMMVITLLLIIATPLAVAALLATMVFGWVALGLEVGKRLAATLKSDWHPALAAGLGTFAITFVAMGVDKLVPCIGFALGLLVASVGLGAVVLTRFGTRLYAPEAAPLAAAGIVESSLPPTTGTLPPPEPPSPDETLFPPQPPAEG